MPAVVPSPSVLPSAELDYARELIFGLVEDSRRQEREQHRIVAVVTWVNAFMSFKRLRRSLGLPRNDVEMLAYGSVVAALKGAGKCLQAQLLRHSADFSQTDFSLADFNACVAELCDDDRLVEAGLLGPDADLRAAEAAFGLR